MENQKQPKYTRGKNPASRRKAGEKKLVRVNRMLFEDQATVTSERLRYLIETYGV